MAGNMGKKSEKLYIPLNLIIFGLDNLIKWKKLLVLAL